MSAARGQAGGWGRVLAGVLGVCVALLWCVPAVAVAVAVEGGRPVIVSTGTGVGGEVTVSGWIDPEGVASAYEIVVECPAAGCGLPAGLRVQGSLPAVAEVRTVTLNVTGIAPGSYWFWVRAWNRVGEAFWRSQLTMPAPPAGVCPEGCSSGPPYETPLSQETIEQIARYGGQAPARQVAREQAAQAAEELAVREQAEHEATSKTPSQPALMVPVSEPPPAGSGLTLTDARLTVNRRGDALVELRCLGSTACKGTLTLTTESGGGKHARIAAGRYLVPGDTSGALELRLNAIAGGLLAAHDGRLLARLAVRELAPIAKGMAVNVRLVGRASHVASRRVV